MIGILLGNACVDLSIPPIPVVKFPPDPPGPDPLLDWRILARIDELAASLTGDRGFEIRRAVTFQVEEANRQLDGAATLSQARA